MYKELGFFEVYEIAASDPATLAPGNGIVASGRAYRVVDVDQARCTLTVVPTRWFYPALVMYRIKRSARLTWQFFLVLLSVWNLADWTPATVPTWEAIRPLRWLARQWRRIRG